MPHGRRPRLPRAFSAAALATLLVLLLGPDPGPPTGPAAAGDTVAAPSVSPVASTRSARPDIVLVVTDDQRTELLTGMTQVQRLLVDKGTRFSRAMVPTALCCPSRTSILTGLYSRHTGIYGNGRVGGTKWGGWGQFKRRGLESRTIATALRGAGYRTGIFGKYLNNFSRLAPEGYTPPGWDAFTVFWRPSAAYYQYTLTDGTYYGAGEEDYSTDVLAAKARAFIRATPRRQPLFVMLTPYGPHRPYASAPRYAETPVKVPPIASEQASLADALPRREGFWPQPPLAPDQPRWTVGRHLLATQELGLVREAQTRALLAVDDAVASLVATMRERRQVRNTLFVFMSDNGYLWGEHGLLGKDAPYAPATSVPLVVRWNKRVSAGVVDDRLALNLDVAGTIARAAGVSMSTDGLDLLGRRRRGGFGLEAMRGNWGRPPYCGWRTADRMYVRYADGREELFDYRTDPGERYNLAGMTAMADVKESMRERARAACRPEPPGFSW